MNVPKQLAFAHLLLCSALGARIPPVPVESPSAPAATILNFQADRIAVKAGETVEFSWETRNADSVILLPQGARLPQTGHLAQPITASGIFWLSVSNLYGGESWPVSIFVQPGASSAGEPAKAPASSARAKLPAARTSGDGGAGFWVQFAALASREAAEILASRLTRSLSEPASLEEATGAGGLTLFRVHTGPYATRPIGLVHLRVASKRLLPGDAKPIVVAGSPPLPELPSALPPRRRHRRQG